MIRFFVVFLCWCCVFPSWGNDCLKYKNIPRVILNVPKWKKNVVQPSVPMGGHYGKVEATLIENFEIITDINQVDDGYCVALKTVNAEIGYNDFEVQIDVKNKPNSCEYNAVMEHENMHIKTYLGVVDDFKVDLQRSVFNAADSIMPVWVQSFDDIDMIINKMHDNLVKHPDLILVKQKLHAAEEIKNKKVDEQETGESLKKCNL
ncbi:MAG: hypothetical protein IKJ62_04630 [Alphaproteobacteria bacterium]|nr:hypothetical protein [Alphaproteobacteria bacterium]